MCYGQAGVSRGSIVSGPRRVTLRLPIGNGTYGATAGSGRLFLIGSAMTAGVLSMEGMLCVITGEQSATATRKQTLVNDAVGEVVKFSGWMDGVKKC